MDFFSTAFRTEDRDPCLLSNFSPNRKPLYDEAIQKCGLEDELYITESAYDYDGRRIKSLYALRRTPRRRNLSHFWDVYHSMRGAELDRLMKLHEQKRSLEIEITNLEKELNNG